MTGKNNTCYYLTSKEQYFSYIKNKNSQQYIKSRNEGRMGQLGQQLLTDTGKIWRVGQGRKKIWRVGQGWEKFWRVGQGRKKNQSLVVATMLLFVEIQKRSLTFRDHGISKHSNHYCPQSRYFCILTSGLSIFFTCTSISLIYRWYFFLKFEHFSQISYATVFEIWRYPLPF